MIVDDPDSLLVERLKNGDDKAFRELLEKYKGKVLSLSYHMTNNLEDAEDISQEAFALVYTKIKGFRGDSTFKTWFYRITLNLCRSYNRRRRVFEVLTFGLRGDPPRNSEIEIYQAEGRIEFEKEETKRVIDEVIHSLPTRQREIFVMKHLEGMKIHEIAKSLHCAEGTIKAHLFKAVKKLQKELEGFYKKDQK